MLSRQEELLQLKNYTKDVDNEITMILQSLQWDRKRLLQHKPKITCKFNPNHKIPPDKLGEHEEKCDLKTQGYVKDDIFLPDVYDANSSSVLKLTSDNIRDIINYASKTDPLFKRGDANVVSEPLTLERLQATYTTDERRAIYDVVINAVPSCNDPPDFVIAGEAGGSAQSKRKTKLEQQAELRDLRRRRTRYRVPAGSNNYSHALRALIDSQMEMYTEAQGHNKSKLHGDESNNKYAVDKINHSDKRSSKATDNNYKEYEGIPKITNVVEIKKVPGYDEDATSQTFGRTCPRRESIVEKGKHDIYNNRKHERDRKSYKDKMVKIKYDKYNDSRKYSDRYRNHTIEIKREPGCDEDTFSQMYVKTAFPRKSIDESGNHDVSNNRKQERDRKYHKDEMVNRKYDSYDDESKSSNRYRNYTSRDERDKYSSSSRYNQRYRSSDRAERYADDRASDRHRIDDKNERKRHRDDDSQYKKESEFFHREKKVYN